MIEAGRAARLQLDGHAPGRKHVDLFFREISPTHRCLHQPQIERCVIRKTSIEDLTAVGMAVDQAGHHDFAGGLDDCAAFRRRQIWPNDGDSIVLDEHIRDLERQVEIEYMPASD